MRIRWEMDADREPPYAMFLGLVLVIMGVVPFGVLADGPVTAMWTVRAGISLGLSGLGVVTFRWGLVSASRRALNSAAIWFTAMAAMAPLMTVTESISVFSAVSGLTVPFLLAAVCMYARARHLSARGR